MKLEGLLTFKKNVWEFLKKPLPPEFRRNFLIAGFASMPIAGLLAYTSITLDDQRLTDLYNAYGGSPTNSLTRNERAAFIHSKTNYVTNGLVEEYYQRWLTRGRE